MTSPACTDAAITLNESSNLNRYSTSYPSQLCPYGLIKALAKKMKVPKPTIANWRGLLLRDPAWRPDLVMGTDDVCSLTKRKTV
jgi:hypothetical protein